MDPLEERFRRGYAAFVEGDLDEALAEMSGDVRLVNPDYALDSGVREGLAGLRAGFEGLFDEFEFDSIDVREIVEGPNVAVVMVHIRARGRKSGVPMDQQFAHVWRWRDGRIVSYEWFLSRDEGLAAAGLSPR